MKTSRFTVRRSRYLVPAALVLCSAAIGALLLSASPSRTLPLRAMSRLGVRRSPDVICLGYVDVEGGVSQLAPTAPGRVLEVAAREGTLVVKGTVLVRLDDDLARFQLEQAEAALSLAQTQLDQARINLRQYPARLAQQCAALRAATNRLSAARAVLSRQREMRGFSLVNAQDVAAAEDRVKELESLERADAERLKEMEMSDSTLPVHEAEYKVAACRASVHQARYHVEQCALTAPEAGTVLRVDVSAGEVVGGPNGKAAVLFCPDRPLLVRLDVEQEFVGAVALGQPAQVEDEVRPDIAWSGRVTRIAGWYSQRRPILARPGQFKDVPTVECQVKLDPGRPPFRIGQRVQVRIARDDQ
jgi:multidrug resistance efflux pump